MYNLEISRIIIKLNKYIIEKSHDLISKLEIEDENVKNQLFKDSNYAFYISSILHLDTLRCFLAILKQDNLNELSTYMKYKISCLFSEMEEEFLDNNFEIDTNPYISAQLYTDLFSEKETLKAIRTSQFLENSYIQIDHFLKYSDCDLEDSKIKDDLIMRMCFLRSLLIFLDNDKSNETLYQLNQFIMSETGYYKTKKILNLFGESFRHQKEDIKIPKILTLRKI